MTEATVASRSGAKAFTLLEVVLAIALVVLLMGVLMGFYMYAMNLRAEITGQADLYMQQRMIMDMMTRELRCANIHNHLQLGLEGSTSEVRFIRAVLPAREVWEDEGPRVAQCDLQLLAYRAIVDEETGEPRGLERSCQRVIITEQPDVESEELCSQWFVAFRYYNGDSWVEQWPDNEQASGQLLPNAVEIIMGLDACPEGMELDEYILRFNPARRIVHLPVASAASEGRE
ncbi:MAG: hypothetical protein GXY38_13505 [Planctomycetes bacterium]|nr:hypothetical protein [Planctomycetota bacterium]